MKHPRNLIRKAGFAGGFFLFALLGTLVLLITLKVIDLELSQLSANPQTTQ